MANDSKLKETINIPIDKIKLHPSLPGNILSSIAAISNNISAKKLISKEGIEIFLQFHPPQVVEQTRQVYCFASIRSYQLAKTFLAPGELITVTVHRNISENETQKVITLESLMLHLIYGLDKHLWDVDLLRLWTAIDSGDFNQYFPSLINKTALAKEIGSDRRRYSQKLDFPMSELKKIQTK